MIVVVFVDDDPLRFVLDDIDNEKSIIFILINIEHYEFL